MESARKIPSSRKSMPEALAKGVKKSRSLVTKLNEKEKDFVLGWARGETIFSSAIRAGYTRNTTNLCYALVKSAPAIALYNLEKARFEADNQMTRKKVMDGLLESIELAKLTSEPAAMINGWKTVGQMCGYFEPVKRTLDVNINGNVNIKRLESMSDNELLKLIKGEVTDVVFKEVEEIDSDD